MESQDVFSQPTEIGGEDPFAGTDFGDFEQPPVPTSGQPEVPIDTSDLPVVDREGVRVDSQAAGAAAGVEAALPGEPGPATNAETGVTTQPGETLPEIAEPTLTIEPEGLPTLTPEQAAAEAERYRLEKGEGLPGGRAQLPGPPTPAEPASTTGSITEPEEAPYPPEPASQPEVAEGDQGIPTPASSEQPPTEPTSAVPSPEPASSETDSEPEDAPEPEEPKSKSGKTTHRRYLIMRVEGTDKFSQLHWYEGEKGKLVPRGTPGAKRQRVVLARGTEDALKFGFAAVGAPQDGVTLVAVAQLHFQPKRIKPKAPEPMRQRLEIS